MNPLDAVNANHLGLYARRSKSWELYTSTYAHANTLVKE